MNCFEFRKLLLTDPRARTPGQERHLAECAACASLARELGGFEARILDAMQVPVPEALAERVLLRTRTGVPAFRAWALAASLVAALGIGIYFHRSTGDAEERVLAAATLGQAHPAVAAIAYVADHEPQLLREGRSGDPLVLRDALTRLGLRLPAGGVTVRYLGKCPVPRGTGEHVVLQTALGQVTLILVPDQLLEQRVMVVDRGMAALVSPARSGGYILVADSLDHIRRIEKMLL